MTYFNIIVKLYLQAMDEDSRLEEEEFDKQYKQWEQQFEEWKEQVTGTKNVLKEFAQIPVVMHKVEIHVHLCHNVLKDFPLFYVH